MSPGADSRPVPAAAVTGAIEPYRSRLEEDAADFGLALLALAKASAKKGGAGFNEPSPQDAAALQVLKHWRRDAEHALARVKAVAPGAPGKGLAVKWLKALIAALDFQRQALSLIDSSRAAEAADQARKRIGEFHRLEARLDRVLT